MTIDTNAAIEFFGTQDDLHGGGTIAAVNSGAYSVTGSTGIQEWTNDDDAPSASLVFDGIFSGNAVAGDRIEVYAQLLNIEDTTDDEESVADTFEGRRLMTTFLAKTGQTSLQIARDITLPNTKTSQEYQFFIKTVTASVNLSSGWTLRITPKTLGPHG